MGLNLSFQQSMCGAAQATYLAEPVYKTLITALHWLWEVLIHPSLKPFGYSCMRSLYLTILPFPLLLTVTH